MTSRRFTLLSAVPRRRLMGAAITVLGFLGIGEQAAWGEELPLKAALMATYLVKFVPFVEWPPRAFVSATSPLTICVVHTALGRTIDEAASGQKLAEHPIEVRHIAAARRDIACHVLFIERSAQQSVADGLNAVQGAPVLTVTDQPDNAPRRGIINFVVINNHVRFEINNTEAAKVGLRLSSQLLALAVNTGER